MPGVPIFVNVIWDPTAGYNTHTLWDPALTSAAAGVPTPNTPTYAIEMVATQMWTAGYALGSNKFTETVKHLGVPICVAGHDIGIMIPDVTIPFPNLWYAIQWPFSGRSMTFTASTVLMDGNPTACSQPVPVPMAMMTCGDPLTLPLGFPLANPTHTLTVGMTMGDFLMGLAQIAISVAIDAAFEWGGKAFQGLASRFGKEAAQEAGERVAREAAEEVSESAAVNLGKAMLNQAAGKLGLTPKSLAKRGVSGLAGFGLQAAQGDANATFKVGVGGGPVPQVGVQSGGDADDPGRFGTTEVGGVPVGGTVGNTPTNDPLDII